MNAEPSKSPTNNTITPISGIDLVLALDDTTRGNLKIVSFWLTLFSLFSALSHPLLLPDVIVLPMVISSTVATLLCFGIFLRLRKESVTPGWGNATMAFLLIIAATSPFVRNYLHDNPSFSLLIPVTLSITAGCVFLSWRWLVGAQIGLALIWGILISMSQPSPLWEPMSFGFLLASFLSMLIHQLRLRNLKTLLELRQHSEERRRYAEFVQSELKTAVATANEREERYALAAQGANDGLWDWNLSSNTIYFSPRWKEMFGFEDTEISDSPKEWLNRVHSDDIQRLKLKIKLHIDRKSPQLEDEHRILHKRGHYVWVHTRGVAVHDENDSPLRMAGSQIDITERVDAQKKLRHDALHDSLTGLPNRKQFFQLLENALELSQRGDYTFAVLFLDLDHFKMINDSLGHLAGDHLLVGISKRLQASLRPGDAIARLGGDEFAILLSNLQNKLQATQIANRISKITNKPFNIEDQEVYTSISIGLTVSKPQYKTPAELLRDADTAMYKAKAAGKARHKTFNSGMHHQAVNALRIAMDLRRAIEHDGFVLFLQPIVTLPEQNIEGFEALIRWPHKDRGILEPKDFIHIASEVGILADIDRWVLREACAIAASWQKLFSNISKTPYISVNLSSDILTEPNFFENLDDMIQQTGLHHSLLQIELKESLFIDKLSTNNTVTNQFAERKISICLDDFGVGYSSLSILHKQPFTTLKLDQHFFKASEASERNNEVIHAIINLALNLKLRIVAEGVQSEEQAWLLSKLQCHAAQGYYFYKPMAQPQFIGFITRLNAERNPPSLSKSRVHRLIKPRNAS